MSTELPTVEMTPQQFFAVHRVVDLLETRVIEKITLSNHPGTEHLLSGKTVELNVTFKTFEPLTVLFYGNGNAQWIKIPRNKETINAIESRTV